MKFNEVIIVEGQHDLNKIKEVLPEANVIITNGREISQETLKMIKEASVKNDIILFLDPDGPGEKIRSIITQLIPNAKHAFLQKNKCISSNKKKVGIEHASKEDIYESLCNLLTPTDKKSDISFSLLFELKLIGNENSAKLREYLSNIFNIGKPNAKTFLKRLEMFGITEDDLKKELNKL